MQALYHGDNVNLINGELQNKTPLRHEFSKEYIDSVELNLSFSELISYLLKWKFIPHKRSLGLEVSIKQSRIDIKNYFKKDPQLKILVYASKRFDINWKIGRLMAMSEFWDHVPDIFWPEDCPWTLDEILNDKFFPK